MTPKSVLKADADEICACIDELRAAKWLQNDYRLWWPRYVYHSNDITNVAAILNFGALLSRSRVVSEGLLVRDCASPTIIGALSRDELDWARLYFRPLVPTQHANEGIRPKSEYKFGGAHMPVPVYLLFSSKEVLSLRGTSFTRGRLGRSEVGDDAEFFKSIDFKQVFHDNAFNREERDAIVNARHAEVLVRDSLSLDYLKHIGCRSAPERDTLLRLLEPAARERWRERIAIERTGRKLFNKRGTFVEAVDLAARYSQFSFYASIPANFQGPFQLTIIWTSDSGWEGQWKSDAYQIDPAGRPLKLNLRAEHEQYEVRVELDGALAYSGEFKRKTKPEVL